MWRACGGLRVGWLGHLVHVRIVNFILSSLSLVSRSPSIASRSLWVVWFNQELCCHAWHVLARDVVCVRCSRYGQTETYTMHVYTTGQWLYLLPDSMVNYCSYRHSVDKRGP